jgi:TolB-like protein/Tfp pilus assembly protein PilF
MEPDQLKKTYKRESTPSIAVLPFVNMSVDPEQEYFCEGMAEELINALTQMSGLHVVSRTAAFQFKGKGHNIHEIAKELNVKTILEGSVRKAGNRIRITAQLVNTEDGYHIWSEKFDRDMEDIFAIQDDISLKIVENLKVKLFGNEKAKLLKRHTVNQDAYQLYLKGRYFWNRRDPVNYQKSIENFQKSIDKDPQYALPYVGLAECYNLMGMHASIRAKVVYPKAKTALEKALKIDDTFGEAYSALGWIKTFYDWDWLAAEQAFKQSIILNPNYATAHQWYSLYLSGMGRFNEAIFEAEKAHNLDPISLIINSNLGCVFYFARHYDKAIEQCLKVIDMDPNFPLVYMYLAAAYHKKEMYEEAKKADQKLAEFSGNSPLALGCLGCGYARVGEIEKASGILEQLNELSKKKYVSPYHRAIIYMGLNDKDQFFESLGKAVDDRDPLLVFLKEQPIFDELHSDPRFDELLKKIGFEP